MKLNDSKKKENNKQKRWAPMHVSRRQCNIVWLNVFDFNTDIDNTFITTIWKGVAV